MQGEESVNLTGPPHILSNQNYKQTLVKRIGIPLNGPANVSTSNAQPNGPKMFCKNCSQHDTNKCIYLGSIKSNECCQFRHITRYCWNTNSKAGKCNCENNGDKQQESSKKSKKGQTNAAVEEYETHATIEEIPDGEEVIGLRTVPVPHGLDGSVQRSQDPSLFQLKSTALTDGEWDGPHPSKTVTVQPSTVLDSIDRHL